MTSKIVESLDDISTQLGNLVEKTPFPSESSEVSMSCFFVWNLKGHLETEKVTFYGHFEREAYIKFLVEVGWILPHMDWTEYSHRDADEIFRMCCDLDKASRKLRQKTAIQLSLRLGESGVLELIQSLQTNDKVKVFEYV